MKVVALVDRRCSKAGEALGPQTSEQGRRRASTPHRHPSRENVLPPTRLIPPQTSLQEVLRDVRGDRLSLLPAARRDSERSSLTDESARRARAHGRWGLRSVRYHANRLRPALRGSDRGSLDSLSSVEVISKLYLKHRACLDGRRSPFAAASAASRDSSSGADSIEKVRADFERAEMLKEMVESLKAKYREEMKQRQKEWEERQDKHEAATKERFRVMHNEIVDNHDWTARQMAEPKKEIQTLDGVVAGVTRDIYRYRDLARKLRTDHVEQRNICRVFIEKIVFRVFATGRIRGATGRLRKGDVKATGRNGRAAACLRQRHRLQPDLGSRGGAQAQVGGWDD